MSERLKNEIAHIIFHVNASANSANSPQANARRQKILSVVNRFSNDERQMSREDFLDLLITNTPDIELGAVLNNINKYDNGEKIRIVLADWVKEGVLG